MSCWVYTLECADASFYAGHTDDLEKRYAEHVGGRFPGYTHSRRPVTMVYSAEFQTRDEALTAERRIKGWSRAKKEALIHSDWNSVRELARRRAGRSPGG